MSLYFAMVVETNSYGFKEEHRYGTPTKDLSACIKKVLKKRNGYVKDEHNVVHAAVTNGVVKRNLAHFMQS